MPRRRDSRPAAKWAEAGASAGRPSNHREACSRFPWDSRILGEGDPGGPVPRLPAGAAFVGRAAFLSPAQGFEGLGMVEMPSRRRVCRGAGFPHQRFRLRPVRLRGVPTPESDQQGGGVRHSLSSPCEDFAGPRGFAGPKEYVRHSEPGLLVLRRLVRQGLQFAHGVGRRSAQRHGAGVKRLRPRPNRGSWSSSRSDQARARSACPASSA